jgi:hypothetical protein
MISMNWLLMKSDNAIRTSSKVPFYDGTRRCVRSGCEASAGEVDQRTEFASAAACS